MISMQVACQTKYPATEARYLLGYNNAKTQTAFHILYTLQFTLEMSTVKLQIVSVLTIVMRSHKIKAIYNISILIINSKMSRIYDLMTNSI